MRRKVKAQLAESLRQKAKSFNNCELGEYFFLLLFALCFMLFALSSFPYFSRRMTPIISKLPSTGTSIFSVMSALATETGAINLSQGFPDFDTSPELIELVNSAMKNGHNQYAPMPGLMALREQIAHKTEKLYGAVYNPDTEITVTA